MADLAVERPDCPARRFAACVNDGWEAQMNAAEREALIDRYEDGYRAVEEALAGINEAELEAREGPGEWSPREIVHHLADSEMTSAVRLRLLIAEDGPTILGYDQEEFVHRLYPDRPFEPSLAAFGAARAATAPILRRLSEAEWGRAGTHSESGEYTVEGWLRIYASHAHDHADQIRRARATVAH
jgi:DinB superfamily